MLKKIVNWQLEKPTTNPFIAIVLVLSILGFFSYNIQYFELDASSDTLLLEDDEDLRYYRNIKARYGYDWKIPKKFKGIKRSKYKTFFLNIFFLFPFKFRQKIKLIAYKNKKIKTFIRNLFMGNF